jgi:hypothetical protein
MMSSVPQFLQFIGVLFVEEKTHPSFYRWSAIPRISSKEARLTLLVERR